MKKIILTMFAGVLMAAGLVVATGTTASAACTPDQYTSCVRTVTKVANPGFVAQGEKAQLCVKVSAKGSNAKPTGKVTIKVKRKGGGYSSSSSKTLSGGKACVNTKKLFKKGKYSATASYKSGPGSTYFDSSGSVSFKVRS